MVSEESRAGSSGAARAMAESRPPTPSQVRSNARVAGTIRPFRNESPIPGIAESFRNRRLFRNTLSLFRNRRLFWNRRLFSEQEFCSVNRNSVPELTPCSGTAGLFWNRSSVPEQKYGGVVHVEMTKVLKTHRHATPILFRNSRVVPEQNSVPERTESIPEQASVPEQGVHSGTDACSGTSH